MKTLSQFRSAMSGYFQEKQLGLASWILVLLSAALLFVFSLPYVIALRKMLLLIAFLIASKSFLDALQKKPKPLLLVVLLVIILQLWMLVIAGLISDHPSSSFAEWRGQWLPTIMAFAIGVGLARTLAQSRLDDPRVAVAMIILVPITIFLGANAIVVIHSMIMEGKFLAYHTYHVGISDQKANIGYLIALLEPILIADMLGRLVKRNTLFPLHRWAIPAILALALFSLLAAFNRNGLLIMLLAFILGAVMMMAEIRKIYSPQKIIAVVLATLVLIFAFALIAYKTDPRWQNFVETVPFAWDIDRDLLWLNNDESNPPLMPGGKPVEISAYDRIAWVHEGWRMLMAHPWGVEISRDTFHNLELEKYGHAAMSHSHNSWIDFGLNVGIPGLLLWGGILLLLAQFGWQAWRTRQEPLGLALAVLVIIFAVRGLFDSIFRDHMIEQFMLVAGLLIGILTFGKKQAISAQSNPNDPLNSKI